MKILIPVDGSEHTKRAIGHLFSYRAVFDLKSTITLIHVLLPVGKLVAASVRSDLIEEQNAEEVEKAMSWARKRFSDSRVPFQEVLEIGDPAEKIIEVAVKGGFDMILMGSRGHGRLPGMVIGSTTFKVLGACKVPMLIVR